MKILRWLKRELLRALPPTLFLFAFNFVLFTNALVIAHGVQLRSMLLATSLAMIAGKVIPLAHFLPFINKFPDKPLLYNIV